MLTQKCPYAKCRQIQGNTILTMAVIEIISLNKILKKDKEEEEEEKEKVDVSVAATADDQCLMSCLWQIESIINNYK